MAVTAPSGLCIIGSYPDGVSIAWTNNGAYDGVHIQRKIGAGGWVDVNDWVTPPITYWVDYDIEDGTQYTYRVYGYIDDPYEASVASNEASTITPLFYPTGLWGTADPTALQIHWTDNTQNESGFYVHRRKAGGVYALVDTVGQNVTEHESVGFDEGTRYFFKIKAYNALIESAFSQEFEIVTGDPPNAPSNGQAQGVSTSQINLSWQDNSNNETGFKVNQEKFTVAVGNKYINFAEGAGELTAVLDESVYSSWDLCTAIKTELEDAGALTYTVTYDRATRKFTIAASGGFSLLWNTGTNKAVDISALCGYSDAADDTGAATYTADNAVNPWTLIATKGVNVTTHQVPGLSSARTEYFQIYAYNDAGNSGETTCSGGTLAAIAPPTNTTVIPVSDTEIDCYFDDNSTSEDLHEVNIYNHTTPGWEVPIELPPNVTGFRMTGLTKGDYYAFHIRAKEGAIYSDYGEGAGVKTIEEPAAPSALALSEIKDKSMRLSWTDNEGGGWDNETGFRIERSTDGITYSEIAVVGTDVTEYLAQDLDPSTQYWFKVRAYNAAGNSAYCAVADDTTLAAHTLTAFEKLIQKNNPNFVFLLEIKPKMTLTAFSLTAAQTYTYEIPINEIGIDIINVYEAGSSYAEQSSIATVEATASSFWFDYYGRILYVHTSDGTNPANFLMEGAFWIYFSNCENISYNDKNYHMLFRQEFAPELSQEIKSYYEGNFGLSAGTISLINGIVGKEPFFDKKYKKFTWANAPVILLAGGEDFDYDEFEEVFSNVIKRVACNDSMFTMELIDFRLNLDRNVPCFKYNTDANPYLESGAEDKSIPEYFGTWADIPATCIHTTNKIFNFQYGRSGSVTAVKRNDTVLILDTDYYVDLQRSLIFFDEDTPWLTQDNILVSFTGKVDSAGDLITNGAEIFKYVMNNYFVLADNELNLDMIYKTKYDRTDTLKIALFEEKSASEIIRNLEHTIRAYSCLGNGGKIGIKPALTTAPSNITYINNYQLFGSPESEDDFGEKYSAVNIYYNQSPTNPNGDLVRKESNLAARQYRTNKELDINAYVSSSSNADSLGSEILSLINKDKITFITSAILFGTQPGDLIYFNRNRFYSLAGSATNLLLRIIKLDKNISENQSSVLAEEV